jgi:glutamine synthetase
MVKKRPDLLVAGRTLFGAPCTKGQKLADHYFGSIPERALAFMEDLERELFRLGVPVRTRHNEVAPCQYEMAPIFEPIPLAVDHSALIMETMVRVGARHDLYVCFHEKPFADLNGSGKHCNWSLANDRQENLLDPGRTPHQNLRFLALIAVVIQAIHQHGSCLGAFVASPGNDLRLGSNEAPPAIISVFLGGMLEKIYTDLLRGELTEMTESEIINLGVSHIPDISRDYTDRNRTSPFAFTGNKFEFRAVGASANPAVSMAALNGAVASAFADCASQLSSLLESGRRRDEAVIQLIRNVLERHQAVLYSGNNYSKEWRTEAKNRGLSEVNRVEDSLATLSDPKHVQFLVDMHVLTPAEITSRVVVRREQFVATTIVETETFLQMVSEFVLPSLEAHLSAVLQLDTNVRSRKLKDRLATRVGSFEGTLSDVLAWYDATRETLTAITGEANHETAVNVIRDRLRNQIAQLRSAVDQAEMIVGDSYWRLPRYRDLLYVSAVQ